MTFEISKLTLLISACICATIGFVGGFIACSLVQ